MVRLHNPQPFKGCFFQKCRLISILLVFALCVSLFSLSVSADMSDSGTKYFEADHYSARYGGIASNSEFTDSAISYNTRSIAMLLSLLLNYVEGGLATGISNNYSYQLSDSSSSGAAWQYSKSQFSSVADVLLAISRNQVISAQRLDSGIRSYTTSLSNISTQIANNGTLLNLIFNRLGDLLNKQTTSDTSLNALLALLQPNGSLGLDLKSVADSTSGISQMLDTIDSKLPVLSNYQYHYTTAGDTLGYALAAGQNGSFWHAMEMGLRTLNEQVYSEQNYLFNNSAVFSSGSFYTDVLNKLDSISSVLENGSGTSGSYDDSWLKNYFYPDGIPGGYSYKVATNSGNVTSKSKGNFFSAALDGISGLNTVTGAFVYDYNTYARYTSRYYMPDTYALGTRQQRFPIAIANSLGAIADLLNNMNVPVMNGGLFLQNAGDELLANSRSLAADVTAIRDVLANSKDSALDNASSGSVTNVTNIYNQYQPDDKFNDASSGLNSVLDGLDPGISVTDGLTSINNLFDSSSDVGNWGWFSSETRNDIDPSLADSDSGSGVSELSAVSADDFDVPDGQQIVWVLDSSYSWASLVG